MADGLKINTKGLDELIAKFKDAPDEIIDELNANIEAAAKGFVARAKRDAPKDVGFLAGAISYQKDGPAKFTISSQSFYAGFLEFGTKKRYKAIPGYENVAAQLKGIKGGTYQEGLANIKGWVKRKGIRFQSAGTFKSGKRKGQNKDLTLEQTAFIIFSYILFNGIKPQPYFFKQVEPMLKEITTSLQSLEKILD